MKTKLERPDSDGLDMCRGGIADILGEECSRWSYQAGSRRPKRRLIDVVREDMQIGGVREENIVDR